MGLVYFAHNGIDHASHVESAAHESNTLPWVIAATLVTVGVLYIAIRLLNKAQAETAEEDEED